MSEQNNLDGISVPTLSTDEESFQGSMQQILAENIGKYVICEFLVGTDTLITRQGILEFVAPSYLVLHDDTCKTHIICDSYALRFVSICFDDGEAGRQSAQSTQGQDAPSSNPPGNMQMANNRAQAQAAVNYAKRKSRR